MLNPRTWFRSPTAQLALRNLSDPYGYGQVFYSTYSAPDTERVQPTFFSYAQQGYAGNAVVFAIIGRRLSLFSETTFKWQNVATKKLYGSPALQILETPWP